MVGMSNSQSPYRMRPENRLPKFESRKNPFAAKPEAPNAETEKTAQPATAPAPNIAPNETYPLFGGQFNYVASIPVAATKAVEPETVPIVIKAATETVTDSTPVAEPVFEQRRVMQPEPKGLVDESPLGLKTGTPTRAPLPAPVVAPAKNPAKQPKPAASPEQPKASPENGSSQVAASLPKQSVQKIGWFASLLKRFRFSRRSQKVSARPAVQTELSLDRVRVVRNDLNEADLEVVTIKRSEKAEGPPARSRPSEETEAGSLGRIASRIFGASESLVR